MKQINKFMPNSLIASIALVAIAIMFTPSISDASKSSTGITGLSTGGYSVSSSYQPVYQLSPSSGYSVSSSYRPVYQLGGGGGSSYIPAAASRYIYNTPTSGGGGGYTPAPQMQYVYSSNKNTNTNANSNTNTNTINSNITNTFNPTNNNDINVVVLGAGGTQTPTTPVEQSLNGYCVVSPTTVYVNQEVHFSASASGGNGSYSYQWYGDNGINSGAQSFSGRFSYAGQKNINVTIRSGSQTITKNCNVYVQEYYYQQPPIIGSNVTVVRDQNLGTPVSGVFLNQVPDTGISFSLKMTLFAIGLTLWSLFAAYVLARKTKRGAAFAASAESAMSAALSKAEAFKISNMRKKGIIA